MNLITSVTIFGGAKTPKQDREYQDAFTTAQLLAGSGLTIVDGGGPGIMLAATSGAKSVNGKTAAVFLEPDYATTFEGKERHVHADIEMSEKNYLERTRKLMELGDAYVFFNGGSGTISEFGMCWVVARLYFGYHKPIILYGEFWSSIIESLSTHMHIRPDELRVLQVVKSPEEVLTALEKSEDLIEQDRRVYIENPGEERCLMLGPDSNRSCSL